MRHWGLVAGVLLAAGCSAGSLPAPPAPSSPTARVRTGLEVLVTDSLHLVRGHRVGLVSNAAAVDGRGVSGVDALRGAGVRLVALFSPEHGFRGSAAPGEAVESTVDSATGLPIYSLYGRTYMPTPAMLEGLDLLLVDLQDVGARYFTWLGTTVDVMRAAERQSIPVLVLDRPNPIGGSVAGNILDTAFASYVGRLAVPMRHGLTLGELALLAREDLRLGTRLGVIPAAGWQRTMDWNATGLPFTVPSPNLRDLEALYHYPGSCLFEGTNLSVGRGTARPFHQVGAPWLDTAAVLSRLKVKGLPGVRFEGTSFTPQRPGDGKYADTALVGIRLVLTDPASYDPVRVAVEMLAIIRQVHPAAFRFSPRQFDRLAGGTALREAVDAGQSPSAIMAGWRPGLAAFERRVAPFRLYR
jgi:uncharacterized protein YbbC (DUF1343 family)